MAELFRAPTPPLAPAVKLPLPARWRDTTLLPELALAAFIAGRRGAVWGEEEYREDLGEGIPYAVKGMPAPVE